MSSLAGKLAELEKEVFELLQEKHTLTAEIATLRTRLDALVTAGEKVVEKLGSIINDEMFVTPRTRSMARAALALLQAEKELSK